MLLIVSSGHSSELLAVEIRKDISLEGPTFNFAVGMRLELRHNVLLFTS